MSNQQPQQPKPQGIQVGKSRIGGVNRVDTSLLLLDKAANKSEVVLATGRNFPDGLVAGALAGASKSGVVLTMGTTAIEPETLNKLKSAGTSKVTIVGGTGVVSQGVEDSLKAAGIQVERIAGTDRYDTAFRVFDYMKANGKLKLDVRGKPYVFVATGKTFPDALAAGALAASTGQLLVLANPNSATLKVPAGTKNLVFIGGEGANPDKYAVIN
ncbi:cell wall-binding repeat-containing protein [Mobiluncus mulieris]|uniref:cell wall-binding repeat-containing protein n=1 Tax=Mobiluncus mulieris TaxID=2052 RepID=UPI002016339B|nr:cell wall-binding repeat-containing protein [Mobiluncus mulieris]